MGKGIERFNAILAEQIAALRAEIAEIDATMERLTMERKAVLGLLAALEKFQRPAVSPNGRAPWRYIIDVMQEGKTYDRHEIVRLTSRTLSAISVALGEEVKRGTVRRVGKGQYQKVETPTGSDVDASSDYA